MACDAVLLIAFGGPEKMADVRPFVDHVLRGRPVRPGRVEEVVRHYELIGGRSPLNDLASRSARELEERFRQDGWPLRVYLGMRNWHPFLHETLHRMSNDGVHRFAGFILAPHQSDASWGRYQRDVAEARAAIGNEAPEVDFTPGWHSHPLFIDAVATETEEALVRVPAERRADALVVFTAHSIPVSMANQSPYVDQLRESARLVADRVGLGSHEIAYQSRSGNPRDPWLEPDLLDFIRQSATRGVQDLVVVPIGFVYDHVEVLYDLDIEARQLAASHNVKFVRASTVGTHPTFVRMMSEIVREHAAK